MTDTLGRILTETAQRCPDQEAIVFEDTRLTWQEVDRQTDSLALALLDLGIQPGERVGILSNNRPEYVVTYLAVARIGAIFVGFNINYTVREIREYAALVQPAVMVVQGDMDVAVQLQPTVESLPSVGHFLSIGPKVPDSALDLQDLLAWQPGQPHPQLEALAWRKDAVQPDDGALIVFTGGTTGRPKPALLTHRNIISNIAAQNQHVGFHQGDRIMCHLPMNHVSGLLLITTGALLAGAAMIQTQRFHPAETLALVKSESITILGQVPTMWIMEFLLPDFDSYDLSSLRTTIVAGAPTPDMAMRKIASLGPRAVHGYGLTEVGGMVAYTRPEDNPAMLLRNTGRSADEFELIVGDADGRPVQPGVDGEILVRGECVMPGYYGDAEATAAQMAGDGWLRTGDLGRMDADGFLTITGRSKDMFISGGYNVYPWEVENYLYSHPDVALCACVGVADPVMGEVGALFIQPRSGVTMRNRDVRNFCKQGLARYKTPRYVYVMEEIPLTAVGKVDKCALGQSALATPSETPVPR